MSELDEEASEEAPEALQPFEEPSDEFISSYVIDSYSARMSSGYGGGGGGGGGGGSTTPAIGTKSNPKVLTQGFGASTYSSPYWFKCTVTGSADFEITISSASSGAKAEVIVYVLKGSTYEKIQSCSLTGRTYVRANEMGPRSYYVECKGSYSQVTCRVDQHVDKESNSKRKQWDAAKNSGYDGSYRHIRWAFFDKDEAGRLVKYVKEEVVYNWCLEFIRGSIPQTVFVEGLSSASVDRYNILPILKYLDGALSATQLVGRLQFYCTVFLKAGCDNDFNAANAIVIEYYEKATGEVVYDVVKWDGILAGPKGMRGVFSVPYYNSVWG